MSPALSYTPLSIIGLDRAESWTKPWIEKQMESALPSLAHKMGKGCFSKGSTGSPLVRG